jgi:RNA-directed DNA polymerase
LAAIIADLNPMLRGWFGYFKHAYRTEFPSIDGFVRRRLRAILRRHAHQEGRHGHSQQDHRRWPNAFFAEYGLFTMSAAHARASQSR